MNLVFDYDGTIHDSIAVYEPAFRHAMAELESLSLIEPTSFSQEEIAYWIGFSAQDMWESFLPEVSQELKKDCSKLISDIMMELIYRGNARLYPHALEVLGQLRDEGHRLLFLSNCTRRYLEAHRQSFPLDEYFSAFYCAEDHTWQPKPQIFARIAEEHQNGEPFVIIGDRAMDVAIATTHGLVSIGCAYGYAQAGELNDADYLVSEFKEILSVVKSIN